MNSKLMEVEKLARKVDLHRDICADLTNIYERKNHDYGDAFSKSFEEWGMPMACIRMGDKLNRLKALCKDEAKVAESVADTLLDLANYAIMTVIELTEMNDEGESNYV